MNFTRAIIALLFAVLLSGCGSLPPLHRAAAANDAEGVARLIGEGADPNRAYSDFSLDGVRGVTPLIAAAHAGAADATRVLVDRGARIEDRSPYGSTALWHAAKSGAAEVVELLLQNGADVNTCDQQRQSALLMACQSGSLATAEVLIRHGADLNFACSRGETPIMAAGGENAGAIAKRLVEAGADLRVRDLLGRSVLFAAVDRGNPELVAMCLDAGLSPDDRGYSSTPREWARYRNNPRVLALLGE